MDLHAFLPAGFTSSAARGIWHDETSTHVVGYGFNSNTGRREALMWMGPPDLIFRDGFDGGRAPEAP